MAGVMLCEPTELYNILNQHRRFPRLSEPNYLILLDARTLREYNESHIITAREYLVPDSEELACVRYCVVYDSMTIEVNRTAAQHARSLQQFTRHPVLVLRGGYKRFSACYHFLRTQKILWMPQELDNFQPYPVEILSGKLYMGNFKQACNQQIQKDLKIKAQVSISEQPATLLAEEGKYLHISVPDSPEADLFSSFSTISLSHSRILKWSDSWDYVLKCKTNVRPHRGFVKQLSDWEAQIYGTTITDVSEPNY
uniref:Rhodanese domain-containing protein n=1 Tax=Phasianus colchicus TaxID=9054 RepID=A0A669PBA8_PHACC